MSFSGTPLGGQLIGLNLKRCGRRRSTTTLGNGDGAWAALMSGTATPADPREIVTTASRMSRMERLG